MILIPLVNPGGWHHVTKLTTPHLYKQNSLSCIAALIVQVEIWLWQGEHCDEKHGHMFWITLHSGQEITKWRDQRWVSNEYSYTNHWHAKCLPKGKITPYWSHTAMYEMYEYNNCPTIKKQPSRTHSLRCCRPEVTIPHGSHGRKGS